MPNGYFTPLASPPPLRVPVARGNTFGPLSRNILNIAQAVPRIQYTRQLTEESKRRMERQEALGRAFRREDPREVMALAPALGMQYSAYLRKLSGVDQRENLQAMDAGLGLLERVSPYIKEPQQLYPIKRQMTRLGAGYLSDMIGDPARFIEEPERWREFLASAPERLQEMRSVVAGKGLEVQREQIRSREQQFERGLERQQSGLELRRQRQQKVFKDREGNLHWLGPGEPIPRGWIEVRAGAKEKLDVGEVLRQVRDIPSQLPDEMASVRRQRGSQPFTSREAYLAAGLEKEGWRGPGWYRP